MEKDQYECYENLPKLLKRYSFATKMNHCFFNSLQDYKLILKGKYNELSFHALPWELETFAMLSIMSEEYRGAKELKEKKFCQMITAIRDHGFIPLEQFQGKDLINRLFPFLGLQQFENQENMLPYFYRFWCLFEDDTEPVYLKTQFMHFFHCSYLDIAIYCRLFFSSLFVLPELYSDSGEIQSIIHKIITSEPVIFQTLTISRQDYILHIKKFSGDEVSNLAYCLCPSGTWPFITDGENTFFPLPHLFLRSCTTSLLYRLTSNNNPLNDAIGKYCLEPYLKRIIEESGAYEDVKGEVCSKKGPKKLSSDVLAKKGTQVLLLECKMLRPRLSLRYLDEESLQHTINRISEPIEQIYKVMKEYQLYDPFQLEDITLNELWGIVVVFDDPFIHREHCMEAAAERIGIATGSKEYGWLIRHIRIMNLYDVEMYCFHNQDMIDALSESADHGDDLFDITPPGLDVSAFSNLKLIEFKEKMNEMLTEKAMPLFVDFTTIKK